MPWGIVGGFEWYSWIEMRGFCCCCFLFVLFFGVFFVKRIVEGVIKLKLFEASIENGKEHTSLITIHITCTRLHIPAFKNGSKLFPLVIPG